MNSILSEEKRIKKATYIAFASGAFILLFIAWPGQFYFLNDDLIHIPLAANGKIGHNNSIRYIGDLSLKLDALFWNKNAFGYHLTNLILHLINTFLFYKVIKKVGDFLGLNPGIFISTFAPLLFCFYGFHSDALFWVIGRSASLGCLFFLLTLFFFCSKQQSVSVNLLTATFWIAALFSYESVWILPFIGVLLYRHRYVSLKESRGHLISLGLIGIISIVYLVYRQSITSEWLGTYEAGEIVQMNLPVLGINFGKLMLRSLVPAQQNTGIFVGSAITFIGFYSLLSLMILRKKSNRLPWILLHAGWLFSFAPYLSLGISIHTIESERFLYLPSLFLVVAILFTIDRIYLLYRKPVIFTIPLMLLGMHIFYLQKAADLYKMAGNTVKETYIRLEVVNKGDRLVIKKIPETIEGIPVFRKGFSEGGVWLLKDFETWRITIQSTATFEKGKVVPIIESKEGKNNWNLSYEFSPI